MAECIDAVERAFRLHGTGEAPAPAVASVHVPNGGFHVKAGVLPVGDRDVFRRQDQRELPAATRRVMGSRPFRARWSCATRIVACRWPSWMRMKSRRCVPRRRRPLPRSISPGRTRAHWRSSVAGSRATSMCAHCRSSGSLLACRSTTSAPKLRRSLADRIALEFGRSRVDRGIAAGGSRWRGPLRDMHDVHRVPAGRRSGRDVRRGRRRGLRAEARACTATPAAIEARRRCARAVRRLRRPASRDRRRRDVELMTCTPSWAPLLLAGGPVASRMMK